MRINRQVLLVEKPTGKLGPEHFSMREGEIPPLQDGDVLLRTRLISLDAANRAWMQGATDRAAIESGQVMAGAAIGEVVEFHAPEFKPGDLTFGDLGWQDYAVLPARGLAKLPKIEPMSHLVSVYGVAGLTAYFGLLDVGRPKEGETVLVSAAAGSVGSLVGQIAKIKGCRAIGVAGGADKCDWVVQELGFDACVDYKAGGVYKALKAARRWASTSISTMSAATILEAALGAMNLRGRIACCGAVSQYDTATPATGPRGVPGLIVTKRLTMQGFIVMDFFRDRNRAFAELQAWVATGSSR